MPENESKPSSPTPPQGGESVNPPPISSDGGRVALLERARTFLMSPQVRAQDAAEQRAFLREKGLDEKEVTQILSEVVRYELVFQGEVNANILLGLKIAATYSPANISNASSLELTKCAHCNISIIVAAYWRIYRRPRGVLRTSLSSYLTFQCDRELKAMGV